MRPAPILLTAACATLSCASCVRYVEADPALHAYYRTGSPVRQTASSLERILESVKQINVTGVYQTYFFPEDTAPLEDRDPVEILLAQAVDTVSSHSTRSATAVVISRSDRRFLLLTANHAVHLPDTVIEYFDRATDRGPAEAAPRRIRSISVLASRSNWVLDLPTLTVFEVLAQDGELDLAFIGVRHPRTGRPPETPPVSVPVGDSNRLSMGSVVFALGYPSGYPMVTRGIVGNPRDVVLGSFLIDGLWNEGMSGGIVLAVRGRDGGLEWVGVARSAAAQTEYRLVPEDRLANESERWRPYEGPIYLEEVRRIQYGITLAVPVEAVRTFADEHRRDLRNQGFDVPRL